MLRTATIICVAVVAILAYDARADECTKEQKATSKLHFDEGAKAFRLNNLGKAAEAFKAAYDACPLPLFLYNLGQTYRQLKDNEQALYFYKQFLSSTDPSDSRRHDVEEWIAQLNQQIENQRRIQQAPPPGPATPPGVNASTATNIESVTRPAPPPLPVPWFRSPAGWSLVGAGAIAAVVGGVLVGHGMDLQNAPFNSLQQQHDLQTSSTNFTVAGWTVLGIGAAALVTGGIVFGMQQHRRARALSVARAEGTQ